MNLTIRDAITEIQRELAMRRQVYPRLINHAKMKRDTAVSQYRALQKAEAVLIKLVEEKEGKQTELELKP